MKHYDISQEILSCEVYPGDPAPVAVANQRMSQGSLYNLSSFSMCAHNGTHVDAPSHFLQDGKTVGEIPLSKTIGLCFVTSRTGELSAAEAEAILTDANQRDPEAARRILIKGEAVITEAAARVFAARGVDLIGVESQSAGPLTSPLQVHLILLGAEVCLLEGIRLGAVPDGVYFLHAAPLHLAGFEGAPCRATLSEL